MRKTMRAGWALTGGDYTTILAIGDILKTRMPWPRMQNSLLLAVADLFHADSANFFVRDEQTNAIQKNNIALLNLSWDFTDEYIKYYNKLDPFISGIYEMGACRDSDLNPYSDTQLQEFHDDFIKPQQINRLMVIYLHSDNKLIGHIGIHRHNSRHLFTARELNMAKLIGRMLTLELRQIQICSESRALDVLLQKIGENSQDGIMVLDYGLNPVRWNSKAAKNGVSTGSFPKLNPEIDRECTLIKESLQFDELELKGRAPVLASRCFQFNETKGRIEVLDGGNSAPALFNPFYFLVTLKDNDRPGECNTCDRDKLSILTPREAEIVKYVCRGLSNKEIGTDIGISTSTVATHIQHIFEKMGVSSRAKLVSSLS